MNHRWPVVIFVSLCLVSLGESAYLWGLWQNVQQERRWVALSGPLCDQEEAQRRDIASLLQDGSRHAVNRLLRYGKASKTKAGAFTAITGLKQVNTPYADEKLQELLREEKATFAQEMALAAYQIYGSKEDVPVLQQLYQEGRAEHLQEKLARVLKMISGRSKEDAKRQRNVTFIETKPKR